MAADFGMSDGLGAFALPEPADGLATPWSEATLAALDVETRSIVSEAADRATAVLRSNLTVLEDLAAALDEAETIEGAALDRFFVRVATAERPAMALVAS